MQINDNPHEDGLVLPGRDPLPKPEALSTQTVPTTDNSQEIVAAAEKVSKQQEVKKTEQSTDRNDSKSDSASSSKKDTSSSSQPAKESNKKSDQSSSDQKSQQFIAHPGEKVVITINPDGSAEKEPAPLEEKTAKGFPPTIKTLMLFCGLAAAFILAVYFVTILSRL